MQAQFWKKSSSLASPSARSSSPSAAAAASKTVKLLPSLSSISVSRRDASTHLLERERIAASAVERSAVPAVSVRGDQPRPAARVRACPRQSNDAARRVGSRARVLQLAVREGGVPRIVHVAHREGRPQARDLQLRAQHAGQLPRRRGRARARPARRQRQPIRWVWRACRRVKRSRSAFTGFTVHVHCRDRRRGSANQAWN